jgi:hypothetical protein
MFTYQKEQHILADRREKLLREAEMQRLARKAARQPARIRRGWLRLLADLTLTALR